MIRPIVVVLFFFLFFMNVKAQSFDAKEDLAFEDVFAGYSETTNYNSNNAGRIRINLTPANRTLRVRLTLPSVLSKSGSHIPITFSSSNAAYKLSRNNTIDITGATLFNPNAPLTKSMGTNKKMIIWLGGTVTPPVNAESGTYNGSITISAEIL